MLMSISPASLWLILALILAGMEMFTGTFYMLAFAIGMVCGALAAWLGFAFPGQIIIVAIVSLIAAAILRRWKKQIIPQTTETLLDIGQRVHVLDWRDTRHLRVQHRGSQWDAALATDAEGGHADYYIVAMQGSTLILHHLSPLEKN